MSLFTPAGRAVLGATAVLYATGVSFGYPELVALASAGLVVLVVGVGSVLRRPPLAVDRRVQPDRVTVGTPVHALVRVRNLSRRTSAPFVASDHVGGDVVDLGVAAIGPLPTVSVP